MLCWRSAWLILPFLKRGRRFIMERYRADWKEMLKLDCSWFFRSFQILPEWYHKTRDFPKDEDFWHEVPLWYPNIIVKHWNTDILKSKTAHSHAKGQRHWWRRLMAILSLWMVSVDDLVPCSTAACQCHRTLMFSTETRNCKRQMVVFSL